MCRISVAVGSQFFSIKCLALNVTPEAQNIYFFFFVTENIKKSDLTLIEINVIREVPFYFINIITTYKIISGITMTLTSRHKFDLNLKA